jgi:hypothetical protein
MLDTLSHLHDLHVQIRTTATRLSQSHDSMVCRAVSSAVVETHLGKFMDKIIQVESAILRRDAGYVAAYEIVPLSTVVSEFAPWTRRLEFLWTVVRKLDPTTTQEEHRPPCGATALDLLEKETHTGYSDIEHMAVALLTMAQKTWMQAVSLWVLYGKKPAMGSADFCIQANPKAVSAMDAFIIDPGLTPALLNRGARHALLSAGGALNQLHSRIPFGVASSQGFNDPSIQMLQHHLALLGSLKYPLNPSLLENTLASINNGISENALSQILPRAMVMRFLNVIWRYMLLGQGEFAVALISHADDRTMFRHTDSAAARPVRKIGKLDGLASSEAELNSILSRALAELAVLQADDDLDDDISNLARTILSFQAAEEREDLIATILPTTTLLRVALPKNSPLHLFLSAADANMYAAINAYLLSIHRADLHLSTLWKLSSLRRSHPSPLGPPRSASRSGQARLRDSRLRDTRRNTRLRCHWNSVSKLLFLVNELQVYLQGEVIESSWVHFQSWLEGKIGVHDSSAKSSRPATASSAGGVEFSQSASGLGRNIPTDPRAMADAHRTYLHALHAALFLTNKKFIAALQRVLMQVDHLAALFSRLQAIWQGLDLQDDEGVVDAFSNYAQDETEMLTEMDRTRDEVDRSLSDLVEEIRNIEKQKRQGGTAGISPHEDGMSDMGVTGGGLKFVPWQARTVDRLIMKLDNLGFKSDEERDDLVNEYDDDD